MLDKATVLTTIFTIVDDTMKGSPMIQQTLKRPGPAPRLSDSMAPTMTRPCRPSWSSIARWSC